MNNTTKYTHLTIVERQTIASLLKNGINRAEIARRIGKHRSTITREIKRGSVEIEREIKTNKKYLPLTEKVFVYDAVRAQEIHRFKRNDSCKHFKVFCESGYIDFVDRLILSDPKRYSPDTANALARQNGYKGVSTKTLYNWIEWGLMKVKNMDLLLKVKRKLKTPIKVQKRCYGESIDNRPKEAENRQTFGHWEGDSIVGKGHIGQIITLVERKTRVGLMFKFDRMSAENMVTILKVLKKRYGRKWFKAIFKSITFDNGGEFAYNEAMSKYTKIYYAHAYRSCERASNENYNGIIRRFVPKGTAFTSLTNDEITRINHVINTLPRKIHGYKTALELFHIETAT